MSKINPKLFGDILDSSIWLESTATRLVWITLLGTMDDGGKTPFASTRTLAARANVSEQDCEEAVAVLSGPDVGSEYTNLEGRRIGRVEGYFVVLSPERYVNSARRYRQLTANRQRVRRFRSKASAALKASPAPAEPETVGAA